MHANKNQLKQKMFVVSQEKQTKMLLVERESKGRVKANAERHARKEKEAERRPY